MVVASFKRLGAFFSDIKRAGHTSRIKETKKKEMIPKRIGNPKTVSDRYVYPWNDGGLVVNPGSCTFFTERQELEKFVGFSRVLESLISLGETRR